MIFKKLLLVESILVLFFYISVCFSAEIQALKGESNIYSIWIKGEIKRGDLEKFTSALNEIKSQNGTALFVSLFSIGGDAIEAIKIGELVRTNYLITNAPKIFPKVITWDPYTSKSEPWCPYKGPFTYFDDKDCNCASACFLIWIAGVWREGEVLGIHRPTFSKEYFSGLSVDEAEKTYNQYSEYVKAYCKKMNIPQNIIDKMFEISSREIIYLDQHTINTLQKAPFFDELITAKCEVFTKEDSKIHLNLFQKKEPQTIGNYRSVTKELSSEELIIFEQLDKKLKDYHKCIHQIILDAQKNKN